MKLSFSVQSVTNADTRCSPTHAFTLESIISWITTSLSSLQSACQSGPLFISSFGSDTHRRLFIDGECQTSVDNQSIRGQLIWHGSNTRKERRTNWTLSRASTNQLWVLTLSYLATFLVIQSSFSMWVYLMTTIIVINTAFFLDPSKRCCRVLPHRLSHVNA